MRKLLMLALALCVGMGGVARAEGIQVAAAISLKEVMEATGTAYKAVSGNDVKFSFGASGALVTQIKSSGEMDVFISAANKQMDELEAGKLVEAGTRRVVVKNALVVVVPAGAKNVPASFKELAGPEYKKIALGEPKTVPAGQYGVEVLKSLKIFEGMSDRLVYGANVRQVLVYVEKGEVDAGIVYATDAKEAGDAAGGVKVGATAEEKDHEAIVYPGAVLVGSKHEGAAKGFLDYLGTDAARKVFAEHGFVVADVH